MVYPCTHVRRVLKNPLLFSGAVVMCYTFLECACASDFIYKSFSWKTLCAGKVKYQVLLIMTVISRVYVPE